MSPSEYLEAEFRRYFSDAHTISVTFEDDVSIYVDVCFPNIVMPVTWLCEIGSDDDRYIFVRGESICDVGSIITVPLMGDTE